MWLICSTYMYRINQQKSIYLGEFNYRSFWDKIPNHCWFSFLVWLQLKFFRKSILIKTWNILINLVIILGRINPNCKAISVLSQHDQCNEDILWNRIRGQSYIAHTNFASLATRLCDKMSASLLELTHENKILFSLVQVQDKEQHSRLGSKQNTKVQSS